MHFITASFNIYGENVSKTEFTEFKKSKGTLNTIWWDKIINRKNKRRIGLTKVESVLIGTRSDQWRMYKLYCDGILIRLESMPNEEIRNIIISLAERFQMKRGTKQSHEGSEFEWRSRRNLIAYLLG